MRDGGKGCEDVGSGQLKNKGRYKSSNSMVQSTMDDGQVELDTYILCSFVSYS